MSANLSSKASNHSKSLVRWSQFVKTYVPCRQKLGNVHLILQFSLWEEGEDLHIWLACGSSFYTFWWHLSVRINHCFFAPWVIPTINLPLQNRLLEGKRNLWSRKQTHSHHLLCQRHGNTLLNDLCCVI